MGRIIDETEGRATAAAPPPASAEPAAAAGA